MTVIKSEFFLALNQVATERGISADDVLDSIKAAVLAAYKKDYGSAHTEEEFEEVTVVINEESGEMHIFKDEKDITPPGFGRIAAQTARQVILQQIREAEKKTIVQHYAGQVGSIIRGRIIRFEGKNILFDIGKAEGFMPIDEQIRSEEYRLNDTLTVYIKEIREDNYGNSRIVVSRTDTELVKQLFVKEVPEIASGTVKVYNIVREPGDRSKIAVHTDQSGVDPVGACVGQKGIRVKSVTDELGGNEKIDIIQYSEDDSMFVREALSPATIETIELDKKTNKASVFVSGDQAPLAIGKGGVNVNLASRLTGYEIDIVQNDKEESESDTATNSKVETEAETEAETENETETKSEAEVDVETVAEVEVADENHTPLEQEDTADTAEEATDVKEPAQE